MQIVIYNHLTDQKDVLQGADDEVKSRLLKEHPYLLQKYGYEAPIEVLVKDLDRNQNYSACISNIQLVKCESLDPQNHAQLQADDEYLSVLRDACEFLSGIKVDALKIREALLNSDGDDRKALLLAHGLEPNKDSLDALEGVLANISKSEEEPVRFENVKAFNQAGMDFAEMVKRASKHGNIKPVHLGAGKHSKGTLIAQDPETFYQLVLKPGSGKQNPASGEKQNDASQSVREAAFYAVAKAWELSKYLPECHLLILDGQQYAAMKFLQDQWENGNQAKARDPNFSRRVLHLYLVDGTLHKWAALDYILGNPDRNGGNVMFNNDQVKLIDHGSALSGIDFRPPVDKYSFTPYYLRAVSVANFNSLDADQKLRALPRVSKQVEEELSNWLKKLSVEELMKILINYGIDPAPEVARLELLQASLAYQAADLAINSAWVVP